MNTISLKIYPDPILCEYCKPVTEFDSALQDLIDEMKQIMVINQGIGLAAPQVGINKRLFVMQQVSGKFKTIINPVFYFYSKKELLMNEACLSVPNFNINLRRKFYVHFTGYNSLGDKKSWRMFGLDARVVQHEVDHLDGKLICDYQKSYQEQKFGIEV